jgi:hypothetical protein
MAIESAAGADHGLPMETKRQPKPLGRAWRPAPVYGDRAWQSQPRDLANSASVGSEIALIRNP